MSDEEMRDLIRVSDELAKPLWPSIVQLFLWDQQNDPKPRPLGCAVLVSYQNDVFIFTAAHVIGEIKGKHAWVSLEDKLIPFACTCQISGIPEMGNHRNDPLDAAVCLLPRSASPELRSHAISIETIESLTPEPETLYLLLGYPANRTNVDQVGLTISSERMPLVFPELPDQRYVKMGYSKETHLLLRWQRIWKTHSGSSYARLLKGSSGCGIWAFNPSMKNRPQLMATFTEVPIMKGGIRAHAGTRIDVHFHLVRKFLEVTH